jgi:hypothetical protein
LRLVLEQAPRDGFDTVDLQEARAMLEALS